MLAITHDNGMSLDLCSNGEVCSHVGTILITVEQCVQDGLQSGPSVTSKPSVWSRVTKKVSI